MYARDATTISPYALLLFGGALRVEHAARRIVVDEWLSIDASPRTAVLVKQVPCRCSHSSDRHNTICIVLLPAHKQGLPLNGSAVNDASDIHD